MSLTFLSVSLCFFGVPFGLISSAQFFRFFDEHAVEEVWASCQEAINENHIKDLLNGCELWHIHEGNVNCILTALGPLLVDLLGKRVIHIFHLVQDLVFCLGELQLVCRWTVVWFELVEVDFYEGSEVLEGGVKTCGVVNILDQRLYLILANFFLALQNHLSAEFSIKKVSHLLGCQFRATRSFGVRWVRNRGVTVEVFVHVLFILLVIRLSHNQTSLQFLISSPFFNFPLFSLLSWNFWSFGTFFGLLRLLLEIASLLNFIDDGVSLNLRCDAQKRYQSQKIDTSHFLL